MNGFSKVFIAGIVDSDPDLKFSQSGVPIAKANIRVETEWQGEKKVKVFEVQAFRDTAESLAELKEGAAVIITGGLHAETWEDKKSGEARRRQSVIVNSFDVIGVPAPAAKPAKARAAQPELPAEKPAPKGKAAAGDDDDVPF